MSDILVTALIVPGDEVQGAIPAIALTDDAFQGDGMRMNGFSYSVTDTSIIGVDYDRPELGRIRIPIDGDMKQAKLNLMFNLCSGLTPEQQAVRVYLK